jgi:alpha-L-fucosidase
MTMATQWSYKPDDKYKSTRQLIQLLVNIVAKGGNFLVNVGPNSDGELPEPALERMKEIGQWMRINGAAIYGTRPIPPYKVGAVCLTRKGEKLYAICLAAEGQSTLPERIQVPPIKTAKSVKLLGARTPVTWTVTPEGLSVTIPSDVRSSPPCQHAWAMEIEGARIE